MTVSSHGASNGAVLLFDLHGSEAAYYRHDAAPPQRISALGQWVLSSAISHKAFSITAWESWLEDHDADHRGLVATVRTPLPTRDIGREYGADHLYQVIASGPELTVIYSRRADSAVRDRGNWERVSTYESARELLAGGVEHVREQRRHTRALRRAIATGCDTWHPLYPSISALTDWIRECEQRIEAFDRWTEDGPVTHAARTATL